LNSNIAKSMTHHNQTKKLTTCFLRFSPYVGGEEVSWTGGRSNTATRCTWVCQRTLPRRTKGRLRLGLDGALSAPAAWPAKRPALGPRRRAVETGIRTAQRGARRSADGNVNNTPHCTSSDATAPRCGHTGGDTKARRN
jgi:hypothetical protein